MSDLKNKKVVVAGGTSGIGLAITQLAAAAGATVLAFGRSPEYIEKAKASVSGDVTFAQADIHDAAALEKLFAGFGPVDHVAANATGANRTLKPFMEQTAEQFQEAFGKFWGYTNLVKVAVPHLTEKGSITLTSGTPSRKKRSGQISLSCVGASVEAFSRALATEIAPKRINVVAPGVIDTTMYSFMGEKKDETLGAITKGFPIGRAGKPEEVASAIIYTMTCDYITGTTIDIDGGLLLS